MLHRWVCLLTPSDFILVFSLHGGYTIVQDYIYDTNMSCTIVSRGYRPFLQVTAKVAGAGVSQGKAVDLELIDVPVSVPMCSAVKLTS